MADHIYQTFALEIPSNLQTMKLQHIETKIITVTNGCWFAMSSGATQVNLKWAPMPAG